MSNAAGGLEFPQAHAEPPHFDDGAHGRGRSFNDWLTAENLIVRDDVEVLGGGRHGLSILIAIARRSKVGATEFAQPQLHETRDR